MKKKKKQKPDNTPKRLRLKRPARLQSAKAWIATYEGKKLVRSYAKRYGTNLLCAILELRLLGVEISVEYEEAVKKTIEQRTAQKLKKNQEQEEIEELNEDQDWDFAFIAGYTSGGAPYGIRWDEMPDEEGGDFDIDRLMNEGSAENK